MTRLSLLIVATAAIAACAPSARRSTDGIGWTPQCCAVEGKAIAAKHRVSSITSRRFTHAELWGALDPFVRAPGLSVSDIGRSVQGRPIRAVTFGTGPVTVLLWSQMHGDESTASMSLADLIAWFASPAPEHASLRNALASKLKIVMIPMLNPDGAELFQRENAVGVDVNRDARNLATPEARALKSLRDSIKPAFGFNLHDQNARTLTGNNGNQVAIALLAPAADEERTYGPTRTTARLVASVIASVLKTEIPGRLCEVQRRARAARVWRSHAAVGDEHHPASRMVRAIPDGCGETETAQSRRHRRLFPRSTRWRRSRGGMPTPVPTNQFLPTHGQQSIFSCVARASCCLAPSRFVWMLR